MPQEYHTVPRVALYASISPDVTPVRLPVSKCFLLCSSLSPGATHVPLYTSKSTPSAPKHLQVYV